MRSILTWLSVVVVFGAIYAQAIAASPRYSITQLRAVSTAAGVYSNAYDINDNGVVVGSESVFRTVSPFGIDWAQTRAIRWDASGNPTLLPSVAGYGSEAYAINNLGKAVGMSVTTSNTSVTYGPATIFAASASFIPNKIFARDINDAGLVVGGLTLSQGFNDGFVYNSTASAIVPFTAGGYTWNIDAVNEQSRIIGNSSYISSTNPPRPAALGTSQPTFLYSETKNGRVNDINESNLAVGSYQSGLQGSYPTLFNGTNKVTPSFSNMTGGEFFAVNDRGVAVGGYYGSAGSPGVIYIDNTGLLLSTRVDNATRWTIRYAYAINNRGQIVGQGQFDHDNNASTPTILAAYRLDPIRSPGDTNYDNVVNFTDLLILAQNYGRTGNGSVFWETGDFNFDWAVNFDDLLTLSQRYSAAGQFESDWQLARSLVPEPMGLSFLSLLTCLRSRRRTH